MSGKRSACSDLNHDNWDREDDPEDPGSFARASDDILKTRVIKVAKRRNVIGSTSSPSTSETSNNLFSSFGGFTSTTVKPAAPNFGFLNNLTNTTSAKTNGEIPTFDLTTDSTSTPSTSIFKIPDSKNPLNTSTSEKKTTNKPDKYWAKIKGLNQSVSNWIKKHVDTNPFLNLTPVFRDYEKFLDELENEYKDISIITSNDDSAVKKDNVTPIKPFTNSIFGGSGSSTSLNDDKKDEMTLSKKDSSGDLPKKESISFGSTSSTFTFGNANNSSPASNPSLLFKFGSGAATGIGTSKPFTFTNVAALPSSKTDNGTDDATSKENNEVDEDEPPKNEFTPVVEEGHIYTIRCKVFVRKDGQYTERGVGNLYLKPVPDNEKVQLIVRADTSLGNLLCNFILSSNIPMQRMGKKDVMLACLPTPDSKPPPVPVLFRVKSPEEADELLKTLEKHKK